MDFPTPARVESTRTVRQRCSPASDRFRYFEVTPLKLLSCPRDVQIVEVDAWTQTVLFDVASETRGPAYAKEEVLDDTEPCRAALAGDASLAVPRAVRRAWLALDKEWGRPLAALIAHRHPSTSGFNLNRSDLLVCAAVEDETLADLVNQLISAATDTYADFPPGYIPVVADDRIARVLRLRGDRIAQFDDRLRPAPTINSVVFGQGQPHACVVYPTQVVEVDDLLRIYSVGIPDLHH